MPASQKTYFVYILTNKRRTTLYIGVTNSLSIRLHQHLTKENPTSFASRYNLTRLIHFEPFASIENTIAREKQLKGWTRAKKMELSATTNPRWENLAPSILDPS